MSKEQKLIDIVFSIGMTINMSSDIFRNMSQENVAKWIRKQLSDNGFKTRPIGSSWGVLITKDGVDE